MKEGKKVFSADIGMDRDTHPSVLKQGQYTFAKNILHEGTSGDGILVQNEPSNIKCVDFKEGFVVVGVEPNHYDNYTLYLLHNPATKVSMIGKVPFTKFTDPSLDEEEGSNCHTCNKVVEIDTEKEYCTFTPLISDECDDKRSLGFSLTHPFKKNNIIIKKEKCGTVVYINDFYNPPRYINLSNLEQYKYISEDDCTGEKTLKCTECDQSDYVKCPNCDLMRVFSLYKEANLEVEKVSFGGDLPQGSYEVLAAYSDVNGNEISGYFSKIPPIKLFDTNNVAQDVSDFDKSTGYGLRLSIKNLDSRFKYYKVALIYRSPLSSHKEGSPMMVLNAGTHPTTNKDVLIYDIGAMTPMSLNDIVIPPTSYERTEMMAVGNGYLFQGGLIPSREINLQPIFNLMGAFLEWRTVKASEGIYSDAANTSKYGSYLRDEIYPFSGRIKMEGGYTSRNFIFANRPPTEYDLDKLKDKSVQSVNRVEGCNKEDRKHRWEFYSTASNEGFFNTEAVEDEGVEVEKTVERSCVQEVPDKLEDLVVYLPDDVGQNYDLIADYIYDKEDIIREGKEGLSSVFPSIYNVMSNPQNYPNCSVYFNEEACKTPVLKESKIVVDEIGEESVQKDNKELSEYTRKTNTLQDYLLTNGNGIEEEDGFLRSQDAEKKLKEKYTLSTIVYQRSNVSQNNTKESTKTLQVQEGVGYALPELIRAKPVYTKEEDKLYSNIEAKAEGKFKDKLAKYSYWYKVKLTDDIFGVELSKTLPFVQDRDFFMKTDVLRVSTYSYDGTALSQVEHKVLSIEEGGIIELSKSDYNKGEAYVVVDFPILVQMYFTTAYHMYLSTTPWDGIEISVKKKEFKNRRYTIKSVSFSKKQTYELTCTYLMSDNVKCEAANFEHGYLGLYESESKYPCNKELYDSSTLQVDISKVPESIKGDFEQYFVASKNNNNYVLKTDTDLRNKNIRHYRFPDNSTSPFMEYEVSVPFQESKVYPIGVYLDKEVIDFFLDVAVDNNLLSQDERDRIYELEIFRGDRSLHKSIIAKGLGYDMYRYSENGTPTFYSNFPYNDLGDDSLHCHDSSRRNLIKHPFRGKKNNKFTFHSPNTHFYKPKIGNELFLEGYQYGASRGKFSQVEGHPKWVLLGRKSYTNARNLAIAESLLDATAKIADLWIKGAESYRVAGGVVVSVNPVGATLTTVQATLLTTVILGQTIMRTGKLRFEWLSIFYNNGNPKNFASFYSSVGFYNKFEPETNVDNKLRGINKSKYLLSGSYATTDVFTKDNIFINNRDREESVYLSLNTPIDYDSSYSVFDNGSINKGANSRFIASEGADCKELNEVVRNIASPYFSIKNWQRDLFGEVNSINWIRAGAIRTDAPNSEAVIFGGDTYITRLSLKRKVPIYYHNAINSAMDLPFEYSSYSNIGFSRFYIDFNSGEKAGVAGALFPEIRSFYNETDCLTGNRDTYVKHPTKIYLFYYGIPEFLVESDINTDYRHSGKRKEEAFYPHTGDYVNWTQELNIPIRERNHFSYNPVYTNNVLSQGNNMLPIDYNKADYECMQKEPNGVIYSLQDNSEKTFYDPNLYYRPLDKYEFKSQGGKLIDLMGVQSEQVFARFENHVTLFNAVDTLKDRLQMTPDKIGKGSGGIFNSRRVDSIITDLGYGGTQHKEHVSCEYGVFYPDMRRGQVFQMDLGGNGINLNEITHGLRNWFKEHLPFKILQGGVKNLTDLDLDNKFASLGVAMGWDSRFRRVLLTKKDFLVKDKYKDKLLFTDNKFYFENKEIVLGDKEYFTDASFTVGYSPVSKSWISYYDYKPNYYISFHNYFQAGLNNLSSGSSLWSHLLTNKSYTTFFGEKYPWSVETVLRNELTDDVLRDIHYHMDSVRYHNYFDSSENRMRGFTEAWVYNKSSNSGQLNLIPKQKNNLYQELQYPKVDGNIIDILATEEDKRWSFNTFFNRVRNEYNNVPVWYTDINDIDKQINPKALAPYKGWGDRLRGDWFLLRLQSTGNNDFKQIFKWGLSDVRHYF